MSLEKYYNDWCIIWLTKQYVRSLYIWNWCPNNQITINIKNKIVVQLWGIYKGILDDFLASNIDKSKVLEFILTISNLIWVWIIDAKTDIFWELLEKNTNNSINEDQIKFLKDYLNHEIDKSIYKAEIEMNTIIDIFRERCIEILLDKQKSMSWMLKMSHTRDKWKIHILDSKIETLYCENQKLNEEIIILNGSHLTLTWEIVKAKETIQTQSKSLRWWFKDWTRQNTKISELEREKDSIMSTLWVIEQELLKKKRILKWTTLIEKINWILKFTTEIQKQETNWQQTFVKQQNIDAKEIKLTEQITHLEINLQQAKAVVLELNAELIEEQTKNQVLTSSDEKVIKKTLLTQITDYFCFLLEMNEFINQTKQEELELKLKMTYYRAKVLDIEIIDYINDHIKKLWSNYKANYPYNIENIETSITNLKNFLYMLQYGNNYFNTSIKKYKDVIDI